MQSQIKKPLNRQSGAVKPLMLLKLVIGGLLIIWLLSLLVQLFWMLMPQPKVTVAPSEITPSASVGSSLPKVDIGALKDISLFGKVVVAPQPVAETVVQEKVAETKLNLTLKGTFAADDSQQGQAIIANGSKQDLYRAGEEIKDLSSVKLLAVYSDRVTLENRGRQEALYLYPEGERSVSSEPSPFVGGNVGSEVRETARPVAAPEARAKRLNQIMRVVRERDKTTGDMLGFRVLPGRDRESFEQSGLKVNDIITAIDGEQLNDLRSAMTVYRSKREATQVSLSIQREGSPITVDIDLSSLNI